MEVDRLPGEGREHVGEGPGDEESVAGGVDAERVDAMGVGTIEERVGEHLVDVGDLEPVAACRRAGGDDAEAGLEVDEGAVGNEVGVGGAERGGLEGGPELEPPDRSDRRDQVALGDGMHLTRAT